MRQLFFLPGVIAIIMVSCKSGARTSDKSENSGRTPVTITHIDIGPMEEVTELNAVSSFLLKTPVKAIINGYIREVNVHSGESVIKGQQLFTIRTKEAENLGNTVNALDSSFRFKGQIAISSPGNGYITQLNFVSGDYVQDGEVLATISSKNSLVFLLEIPFELKPCLPLNKSVEISLGDGRLIRAALSSPMPIVDPVSQTQSYIIHVPENLLLPENLIAKVKFIRQAQPMAVSLPKEAVLTNEVQSDFWIMKMIDSTTAVKIHIKRGLETSERIEILEPELSRQDKILLTGNYGLPDTAQVTVENK
jgi:hypothetical protein